MLKTCKYCGRIHEINYECPQKPKRKYYEKKLTEADKFRWTKLWQNKRKEIKQRDKNLCQICIRDLYYTDKIYNFNDIQVHHNIPIQEDWNKRLDNDNLISLCPYHHKLAEDKIINRKEIQDIINEQETNYIPPT